VVKLSKSASMIRKKKEQPATVPRVPDPVPKPKRTSKPYKITDRKPSLVICERVNKCVWYQAPGKFERAYDAICTLATMHYDVKHHGRDRYAGDHIVFMDECPLTLFERDYPEWIDIQATEPDLSKIPPMPASRGTYKPFRTWPEELWRQFCVDMGWTRPKVTDDADAD
jgi:hypothetical protein